MDPLARVGDPAPDFTLLDLDDNPQRLLNQRGKILILNFWSAECPHSSGADEVIAKLRPGWGEAVVVWRIASNANETVADLSAAARRQPAGQVLLDPDQQAADRYAALTTPHVFVIDQVGVLRYAGGLDDTGLRQREASRNYLADAVSAIRNGRLPEPAEAPPFGCALVRYALDG